MESSARMGKVCNLYFLFIIKALTLSCILCINTLTSAYLELILILYMAYTIHCRDSCFRLHNPFYSHGFHLIGFYLTRVHTHTHIHRHTYIYRYIHTYTDTYIHTYIYVYVYVYIHICIYPTPLETSSK